MFFLFDCFCFSETSSVCSSSDTGLFTNDEGRQGNNHPEIFLVLQGVSLAFFKSGSKERSEFEGRQGIENVGKSPVAGRC